MKRQFFSYAQKYVDGAKGDVSGNGMYRRGKRSIIKRKNKKRGGLFNEDGEKKKHNRIGYFLWYNIRSQFRYRNSYVYNTQYFSGIIYELIDFASGEWSFISTVLL